MESFISTQLTIPILQVVLLLLLTTVTMLFGRHKLALFINYFFTLYWGYIANIDIFSFTVEGTMKLNNYTLLYFGFGFVIIFLAAIGLIMNHD
jgi:hypothetical protein